MIDSEVQKSSYTIPMFKGVKYDKGVRHDSIVGDQMPDCLRWFRRVLAGDCRSCSIAQTTTPNAMLNEHTNYVTIG